MGGGANAHFTPPLKYALGCRLRFGIFVNLHTMHVRISIITLPVRPKQSVTRSVIVTHLP
jgi:hypothetical protein